MDRHLRLHSSGVSPHHPWPASTSGISGSLSSVARRHVTMSRSYALLTVASSSGGNIAPLSRPGGSGLQPPPALTRPGAPPSLVRPPLPPQNGAGPPGSSNPALQRPQAVGPPATLTRPGAPPLQRPPVPAPAPALSRPPMTGPATPQSTSSSPPAPQTAQPPLAMPRPAAPAPSSSPAPQQPPLGSGPVPLRSPVSMPLTPMAAPNWPSAPVRPSAAPVGSQLMGPPTLNRPAAPMAAPLNLTRPGAPALAPPPALARPPAPGAPALAQRPLPLAGPQSMPLAPPPRPAEQQLTRPALAPPPPTVWNGSGATAARGPSSPLLRPPTAAASGLLRRPEMTLQKPEPPSMRVLNGLYAPAEATAGAFRPRRTAEAEPVPGEEFEQGVVKVKAKFRRSGKLTAEMKRAARESRAAIRDEKALLAIQEREEIFEVGAEGMMLVDLAERIQVDPSELVRSLFMRGIQVALNQVIDCDIIRLLGSEYGLLVVVKDAKEEAAEKARKARMLDEVDEADIDDLVSRPPVVTVMGHVDHGKTSLLDFIRKSRVAAGEAGGITQGIGAYNTTVEVDGETKTICFLDTPGHEAFSAMRARGAQVTDLAIIIVAADDGVRPQTREAVAHAQAAGVSIIVAINKVDKPGADVERVKQELLELGLVAEEWGGNTQMVEVSAKKGTGITELLQLVSWAAEEKHLMANPTKPGRGTIIEAHLDRRVGPVATLLVQAGTLRVGDIVYAGASYGKVRTLVDDLGKPVQQAGPSIAVQLIGLNATPQAGELFEVAASESDARNKAGKFLDRLRVQHLQEMTGGGSMVTLSSLTTVDEDGSPNGTTSEGLQKLNLIIKGSTVGVVEAIKAALGNLPQKSVTLRYLLAAAGDISESDIDLAAASGALVLGFNLKLEETIMSRAKQQGVLINSYKIIYNLIDDVKAAMEGKLKLVEERAPLGKAEVKGVFGSGKKKVAGMMVTEGKMQKGATVSVKRGKVVVYEGKVTSLRRLKDAVEEVANGLECGLGSDGFMEWKEGDLVECYVSTMKARSLDEARADTVFDISTLV